MKHFFYIFLAVCLFSSCAKKGADSELPITSVQPGDVLVCNEGGFMYSNASLTLYNPTTEQVLNQAFITINGFPLGDVLQSATVAGRYLCLVVNNSGTVIICDAATLRYVTTIKGLTSPRFVASNGSSIFITDLYSNALTEVSLSTLQVTRTVDLGMTSEQIIYRDGFLYTCSWDKGRTVLKINALTMQIVGRVEVALQPNSLAFDAAGRLWVLSDGGLAGTPVVPEKPALTCIDVTNFTVTAKHELSEANPAELCASPDGRTLYYIGGSWGAGQGGIFTWNIEDNSAKTLIPGTGKLFYGLGIDPRNGQIYASDAIDYMQRGMVYRYSSIGDLITSFKADIIPGAFCFL